MSATTNNTANQDAELCNKPVHGSVSSELKLWFGRSLRMIVPLGCSIALICWLFHKVNFADMMDVIQHKVQYGWIALMLVFNTFSYLIRAARWGLQLDAVGIKVKYPTLCASIFGAYALNLMFSGLGEAWRCVYISKKDKGSLSKVVGTDIGDRSSDAIVVIFVLFLVLAIASNAIHSFVRQYAIGKDIVRFADNPFAWCMVALTIFIIWTANHFLKRFKVVAKIDDCFTNIWRGFKVLFTLKHKWWYVWLTLGIWVCYFMQTYICYFGFPFTHALVNAGDFYGIVPGLVTLLFGSLSMAIPSSGGLGPWNLAIMFALSLYGINQTDGAAFAMLLWSCQAALQVFLGIITAIYIMITKD